MASILDWNNIPAMVPPPGMMSDLKSTYNQMQAVSIFTWTVCASLVIICVALRSFTRFYVIKKVEFADFIPIFACIGTVVYIALSVTDLILGAGKHTWNISASNAIHLGYLTNIIAAVYAPVILLAKSSVVIPLMRTFVPNGKTWLYWSYVSILVLNVGYYFSGMMAVILACTPREKIWNPLVPGTCINQNTVWLLSGVWNIFTDFSIIILPLFSIWHLRLGMKYKLGISIMFLTTVFALFSSIARMYYTVKLITTDDRAFVYAELGLWTSVSPIGSLSITAEIASLICCSCMPVFPRLYHWLRDNRSRTVRSDQIEFVHPRKQQDVVLDSKSLVPSYNTQVSVSTQTIEG